MKLNNSTSSSLSPNSNSLSDIGAKTSSSSDQSAKSILSLYSGNSSESVTPKSTSSASSVSTSRSLSSPGEEADGKEFSKPHLPSRNRTQAQTSSSSGSIPSDGKIISSSISTYPKPHKPQDDEVILSQELFAAKTSNGHDGDLEDNSPEIIASPKTASTPFVCDSQPRAAQLSLQLSGDSCGSSQPSVLHKPDLLPSPSKKLQFSSSSSSEDEARRKQRLMQPETQGFEVPQWCKQHQNQSDSLQSSSDGSPNVSLTGGTSTCAPESTVSVRSVDLSTADRSEAENVVLKDTNSEMVLSGADLFNPAPDSEHIENRMEEGEHDVNPTQSQVDSQPCLNFELSQDFSQKPLTSSSTDTKLSCSNQKGSESESLTPFHFSLEQKKRGTGTGTASSNVEQVKPTISSSKTHALNENTPKEPDAEPSKTVIDDGARPGPSGLCKDKQEGQFSGGIEGTIKRQMLSVMESTGLSLHDVMGHVQNVLTELSHQTDSAAGMNPSVQNSEKNVLRKCREKITSDSTEERVEELVVGCRVFALWNDERYYAGKVVEIVNDSVTVEFYDHNKANVPRQHVCEQKPLKSGQNILVAVTGGYYRDGVVQYSKLKENGDQLCTVFIDKEVDILESVDKICFTPEQFETYVGSNNNYSIATESKPENTKDNDTKTTKTSAQKSGKKRKKPCDDAPEKSGGRKRKALKLNVQVTTRKTGDKKLFSGYCFLLTSGSLPKKPNDHPPNSNTPPLCDDLDELTADEDEEETPNLDKNGLAELITKNGGSVIKTLQKRKLNKSHTQIICISNRYPKTFKFLYSIAVGIPVLWDTYLRHCVDADRILPYDNYLIPAGKDLTGVRIHQVYQKTTQKRAIYTPLYPLRIFVYIKPKRDTNELNVLLETIGCERVGVGYLSKKSRALPIDILTVDYILTLEKHVPSLLREAAVEHDKKIVTDVWLLQCVINNEWLEPVISPKFVYRHQDSSQKEHSSQSTSKDDKNSNGEAQGGQAASDISLTSSPPQ